MKIVFFDGYCSLCNGLVDWLIKRDHSGEIKFASLQGATAKQMLPPKYLESTDTVVYHRDGKLFEQSSAILFLLSDLGGAWMLTKAFFVIPRFARDILYKIIAKNRYRLFKKRDTCRLPSPDEKERLLS